MNYSSFTGFASTVGGYSPSGGYSGSGAAGYGASYGSTPVGGYTATWETGSQHGRSVTANSYPTSTSASFNAYDPLNPGYDARSGGESYTNPGLTAFMGATRQTTHGRAGFAAPQQAYGSSQVYSPSSPTFFGSGRESSWRSGIFGGSERSGSFNKNKSIGGSSASSNPKKNQSPPKSNSARKIASAATVKVKKSESSLTAIQEPAPVLNRIIPAKADTQSFPSKTKGKGGVQKPPSPHKQLQSGSGKTNKGSKMNAFGGGYGRGGYSNYGRGGRFGGGKRKMFRKRDNQQDDIPFTTVPEGEPFVTFPVSVENIQCFHGVQSIFTTQHLFPVMIEDKIYESCDHFYQIEKTKQLCGQTSEKMTATVRDSEGKRLDGKVGPRSHEEKGFSAIAKEMVRLANVPKEKVEEWRHTKGLEIIQKALKAKVAQCPELRDALRSSGDKILIHSYAGDAIYGSGTRFPGVKAWCEEMKKNEAKLIVPVRFPLTEETVQQCPVVGKGRNVLGVIMMQLRNMVLNNEVDIRDMSVIFDGLMGGPGGDASKDILDDEMNGFSIGGGSIQPPIGTAAPVVL